MKISSTRLKILATAAYIVTLTANILANALPINGVTTAAVSDSYPNLFAPDGFTFAIWGVIYLFLTVYCIYQFLPGNKNKIFDQINGYFIGTSLANTAWIFCWHFNLILSTVALIVTILVLLIKIADHIREARLSGWSRLCIHVPFSIYFGWVTIATIANITVFLVSVNWDGFGISAATWTVAILTVGAIIGALRTHRDKNVIYGAVFVWAYTGILAKHLFDPQYSGRYPGVIWTISICIAFILAVEAYTFFDKKSRRLYNR